MGTNAPSELALPRGPAAASQARRWLEHQYSEALEGDELDNVKLLTSELINNAVLHGRGGIKLRAALDENRVLIEVIDDGSGFERVLDKQDFDQVGGRGLRIVEAASSRWGVHEGTTHVWFESSGQDLGLDPIPSRRTKQPSRIQRTDPPPRARPAPSPCNRIGFPAGTCDAQPR